MIKKYHRQDQQGKAVFNERNPHTTQQQEPVAKNPDGPKTKTGQGTRTDRSITKTTNNLQPTRNPKKTNTRSNNRK
jgi:hypothetical protein